MRRRRVRRVGRFVLSLPNPLRFGRSGVHVVTIALLGFSLWMLANFVGQVITSAQMERRAEELQAEITKIAAENEHLKEQVAYAESPVYAERIAREQLNYAREGDTVILPTFPDITPTPLAPTAVPLPPIVSEPNWQGWMRALFPPATAP